MSSEIYELSKRDICDLFLQIDYCLGYNDYKSVINRFSYCQSGCVYLEVLGPVMVKAGIMRLQLRTEGQSCDGSDSSGCRRKKPSGKDQPSDSNRESFSHVKRAVVPLA